MLSDSEVFIEDLMLIADSYSIDRGYLYATMGRLRYFGQNINKSGLSSPISPQKPKDLGLVDLNTELIQSKESMVIDWIRFTKRLCPYDNTSTIFSHYLLLINNFIQLKLFHQDVILRAKGWNILSYHMTTTLELLDHYLSELDDKEDEDVEFYEWHAQ